MNAIIPSTDPSILLAGMALVVAVPDGVAAADEEIESTDDGFVDTSGLED